MASEKINENSWGGARKGAGRKEGGTKTKICVSVNEDNWNSALKRWRKKPSWLVDSLVSGYLDTGAAALGMGVAHE